MYAALNHCLVADWADNNVDGLFGQLITVQAGDWILLCTDGLYDILGQQDWPEVKPETDLVNWLTQVHDAVHRRDAYDNGSVVVIRWS
jgi:serine/threonine protein phosphatase PrpC